MVTWVYEVLTTSPLSTQGYAKQFDAQSEYFDAKSSRQSPRWLAVDVEALRPIPLISLAELRKHPQTASMRVLARGNRLSITPVLPSEFAFITEVLAQKNS